MSRLLTAMAMAALMVGCTIEPTPAWVRQLEACQEVKDEALRVECITSVDAMTPTGTEGNRDE